VPNWICDLAKLHDLTVAGVDPTGLISERQLAECLLFQSGRPEILVPRTYRKRFAANRIVIAWDYSAPAARSLAEALPPVREASQVIVVTASDDKEFPTSFGPNDVLEALRLRGVAANHQEITTGKERIAEVLQAFAMETDADLLVMGAFGHSRMRDFILGGATRGVLERLQLPTLLSH